MTTGNGGNGAIPPAGENPVDYSQYSLYQLVSLLQRHVTDIIGQTSGLPDATNTNPLGTLKQSLNELALSLSTQNKKLFNGSNPSFLIDKVTYVVNQLDTQETTLQNWEREKNKHSSRIWEVLIELMKRVPKTDDVLLPSAENAHFDHMDTIRRRAKGLSYDPNEKDDYLTFLYKLLADELGSNKKVNAELIPKKEKTVRRYVDTFLISAEFRQPDMVKDAAKRDRQTSGAIGHLRDQLDGQIHRTYQNAAKISEEGVNLENKNKVREALNKYRQANKILEPIMNKKDEYRELYDFNFDRIKFCEQKYQSSKPRSFFGLFSWI
ncbi:hypothetical protein [Aureicoccus marinus]|uniref:Uncharacterized protein n=1 Tax=Aureicoccus marinus TaxID=754435 RepID=A0A2S7T8U8_9FLAO|nr:hypothetical protein [Aureicoccus marinus]PQJ16349.1 hypothetical protein BST99_12040 [Aureicoccus marinus]